jgi:hypothetical protein
MSDVKRYMMVARMQQPDGEFVSYTDLAATLAERDAADDRAVRAQQLAKLLSDEAVIALSGAGCVTPDRGYIRAYPDGAGPGELGADIRRLAAERDTLRAEVERLTKENRDQYESATEWKRLYEKAVTDTTDDLIGEVEKLKCDIERLQSKYHEAVALLRRWEAYEECVNGGLTKGQIVFDTQKLIATIDSEEAKSEEGTG